MELPGDIEPQAEQQGRDQTPKDKIEDQSKKVVVVALVKRAVRVGYLLLRSNQLAEPRRKNERSDPNPNLLQKDVPMGRHRFPRSFSSCGSQTDPAIEFPSALATILAGDRSSLVVRLNKTSMSTLSAAKNSTLN
jgi:hypothetical protein